MEINFKGPVMPLSLIHILQLIERTRSEITPQVGDRVVYVTEYGDYYGHALIDHMHRDEERLSDVYKRQH